VLALSACAPIVMAGTGKAGSACIPGARVVALDLPATDIVAFAGARLIGAAVAAQFKDGRSDVTLPADVVDIGHSAEPNLELLQALRPDLIVSAWPLLPTSALPRIAPVLSLPVFTAERDRYEVVANVVRTLGEHCCVAEQAQDALAEAAGELRRSALLISELRSEPVYLVYLNGDGISLRVFGEHSMLAAILRRLGIANAWTGEDGIWGWQVCRPDVLRERPEARIVEITQHWDGAALPRQRLTSSPLWRSLPQIQAGRITTLPPVAVLGGISSGLRFASLLTRALMQAAR